MDTFIFVMVMIVFLCVTIGVALFLRRLWDYLGRK